MKPPKMNLRAKSAGAVSVHSRNMKMSTLNSGVWSSNNDDVDDPIAKCIRLRKEEGKSLVDRVQGHDEPEI